ncbi:UvrB/UvrC motif-containing protein [Bacillus sp. JJ1609]|uniref:UvrB/UvrC motif-containing protein n=1 Tax=Bacillus sp. JJ1609 TaxID=3122977 RepID=UPI0030006665
MNLKEKVRKLPLSPGVYLMKDQNGTVIYVGKAKRLKLRVQTYFQNTASHPQKIKKMVANVDDFDYILTDTEFEAFMLECKLIKELKPLFNKRMKSHLSYTYIGIKTDGPYRKIFITPDREENDHTLYFGPYSSPIYVKKAIENLKEYFHINCLHPLKGSPCLNYSLGHCNGLCLGGDAVGQYNEIVDMFIDLLQGTDQEILEELQRKMQQASEEFRFEDASKYRNYAKSLSILLYKENIIQITEENKNIAVIEQLNDNHLKIFLIKGHKIIFSQKYTLEAVEQLSATISADILNYVQKMGHQESLNISKENLDESQIIYSYLNSSNARFTIIPDSWIESNWCAKLDDEIKNLLINVGL